MIATIVCAVAVCLGALVLGQAVVGLCGAARWSWAGPAIGVSVMMLIAVLALHAPGRAVTMAVVLLLAVLAAIGRLVVRPGERPPLLGTLAGLPVFLLALVPFAAAGRSGTLGVLFNNDMASHLLMAEAYRSEAVAAINPVSASYPSGPHALAAVLAQGFGVGVDEAFAGLTIALTVVLAWTAIGALRAPRWWGPFVAAAMVGMPYLVAGYYGQGSFKELLLAGVMVAMVVWLGFPTPVAARLRWVPVAFLLAGALSVYGHPGLVWPVAFMVIWGGGSSIVMLRATRSPRAVVGRWRRELVPLLIGVATLVVIVAPQLRRLQRFFSDSVGSSLTGIPEGSLGNLARPLPFWEAFGIWDGHDYRIAPADPADNSLWIALVVCLVIFGLGWSVRRREWMLPAATLAGLLVWWATDAGQSPYVAAKALVLVTPLLMLVAVRPLVERDLPAAPLPSWWRVGAPLVAAVLLVKAMGSTWQALTFSSVGPTTHIRELQSLAPLLDGRPTLYLGNDDFTLWMFADTPVRSPVIGFPTFPLRPEKPWEYGRDYDVDSVETATLNAVDWVVTPRDAASSRPPEQLELVRRTAHFDVYRRTARIPGREILAEGDGAAALLDCDTPRGRAIVRGGGVAAIRGAVVAVPSPAPIMSPGQTVTIELPLTRGRWDLVSSYGSPRPVEVTAPGLRTTLPANLSRPGPRWPVGRITVARDGTVPVTFHPTEELLTSSASFVYLNTLTAVPVGTERTVPIAEACGRLVDWYRPAPA